MISEYKYQLELTGAEFDLILDMIEMLTEERKLDKEKDTALSLATKLMKISLEALNGIRGGAK